MAVADPRCLERTITRGPGGRILTNINVWSPDNQWIVYDTRSDPAGEVFDGCRIERVHVPSGEVRIIYKSQHGAHCGVATFHPIDGRVIFILGPQHPTPEWSYHACHRQGFIVHPQKPDFSQRLDARDLIAPFTPGALRGGSHLHVWDAAGDWVSFTYEDHVAATRRKPGSFSSNQRNIGVSVPHRRVEVSTEHPRNHDAEYFSVLVTRTVAEPRAGSNEISRACEEAWIGSAGYQRPDGWRQRRALAFQGTVKTKLGPSIAEVFVADLPDDPTVPGERPLAGTLDELPAPPKAVVQRRLTFTEDRTYPGIQGPRHWLRSSRDGNIIAFLARDGAGVIQLWGVSPNGGEPWAMTHNGTDIASAFSWSPDDRHIAHAMDGCICVTEIASGKTRALTRPDALRPIRPEACVFSPNGRQIAFVRQIDGGNQICVVDVE